MELREAPAGAPSVDVRRWRAARAAATLLRLKGAAQVTKRARRRHRLRLRLYCVGAIPV